MGKRWGARPADKAAMCDGKAPLTWAQAQTIMRRRSAREKRQQPFHCPFCRAWHLGHLKVKHPKAWRVV